RGWPWPPAPPPGSRPSPPAGSTPAAGGPTCPPTCRWSDTLWAVLSALVAAAVLSLAAVSAVPVVVATPAGAASPVLTTREVLGASVQGRPIVLVHRTTDATAAAAAAGQPTRTVLLIGSIHCHAQAG